MASNHSAPQVAVIGSGPAGCYLAQSLLRAVPDAGITVFDRLATPYGLVRYGVAADHQHTKNITRQFERLFTSPQVRFAGNVDIGDEVTLDDLRTHFDIVVLATGLSQDRNLGLPGSSLPGVVGAGVITRLLNTHPSEAAEFPSLGGRVVLVGSGNVGIDILRFLVKGADDYEGSDIADERLTQYLENPATEVTIVSRSAAPFAKSDPQMIRELATLPRAQYASPDLDKDAAPEGDRQATGRLAAYQELVDADRPAYDGPRVTLRFGLIPQKILGEDRVEGVEFDEGGEIVTIPADVVVTAIGFQGDGADDDVAKLTHSPSETGRIEAGLYRTGWAKRGPIGAIPENRADAKGVADEIVADLESGAIEVSETRAGFEGLPEAVREAAVDFEEWLAIDAHERERASEGRVRQKLATHTDMVTVAKTRQ